MAGHNKTLRLIASKLGFGDDEKVLNKSSEFERLLQTKAIAGSNITDTSKVAICLDLAASILGAEFDVKTAIKYSGLKPATYANSRKVIENLLELNSEILSTSLLCMTLQCTDVQAVADRILQEYQRLAKMQVNLNLPQYVCMAVYQACRINKVKVPKIKLMEKSRLKPAQWSKLDAEWTKFVDEHFAIVKKKRGRLQKITAVNEENQENMEIDCYTKKDEPIETQVEPYEDWKKRMLEAAYKELHNLKQNQKNLSPRRSPRKTPQKFSPYKSPSKRNGVRLLFPVEL